MTTARRTRRPGAAAPAAAARPRRPRRPRRRRSLATIATPFLLAAAITWLVVHVTTPDQARAFDLKVQTGTNLDGKVVLSPAAERVETLQPDNAGGPVTPGSTITRPVILQNRTKASITFDLDVAQVVGSNAEEVVEIRNGVHEGAAAWATLERRMVVVPSGGTATLSVTIKVPKKVRPGSKPFAVTATQRQATVQTKGAGVTPVFRQVAIFIVQLPGNAPKGGHISKLEIHSAHDVVEASTGKGKLHQRRIYLGSQKLSLTVDYKNTGETLLTPQGTLEVHDIFGRVAARYPIPRFTIYPGGENASDIELKKLPSIGRFTTKLNLTSDAGTQKRSVAAFWLVPTWLEIAFWVLVGILVLIGLRWALQEWLWRRQLLREELAAMDAEELGEFLDEDLDDDEA